MTSFLDSSGPKYTHLLPTLSRWDYDTGPVGDAPSTEFEMSPGTRGGHSHWYCSHSCNQGQEAVKGSKAVFSDGQAVKDNFQTR